ncbi:hypothetical protein C8R46DRAFT_1313669 [Mycena filopes]|nr:hypothetical protein C8R46DRAFT_1313669 [Mycena filopes]
MVIAFIMKSSRAEPFLYAVVALTRYEGRMPNAVLLESKAELLKTAVRHLCLECIDHPKRFLSICPRTTDLSLNVCEPSPDFLGMIAAMSLERLSVHIGSLFPATPIDHGLAQPFPSLTHLTLFDSLWGTVPWNPSSFLSFLSHLPALTHLCVKDFMPPSIFRGILKDCLGLQIFLNIWEDFEASQPEEICNFLEVDDFRFVIIIVEDWVYEWELGARGGRDMWNRAKEFVANKAKGAIVVMRITIFFWRVPGLEFPKGKSPCRAFFASLPLSCPRPTSPSSMVPPEDDAIELSSDLDDDDDNTTPLDAVKRLVTDKPERKWFVSSPQLMKKQEQARKAKERKKRKAEDDTDTADDAAPAKKKGREGKAKAEAVDTGDEPEVTLTAYIRLIKPIVPLPPSRSRLPKPKPETLYIQRGPVQFSSACTLD